MRVSRLRRRYVQGCGRKAPSIGAACGNSNACGALLIADTSVAGKSSLFAIENHKFFKCW